MRDKVVETALWLRNCTVFKVGVEAYFRSILVSYGYRAFLAMPN